jgi:uncharacterized protein
MSTLDPHAPYTLDTRELGRRPGTSQRVRRAMPAPDGMAVGLARVDPEGELDVEILLEAVMEGVLITLRCRVPYTGECARCLDPVSGAVEVDARELFAHDDRENDDETAVLDGDFADVEPMLRDAVVLALPGTVLCREDCPGLCPRCGARFADDPEHAHDEAVDPRWVALSVLADPTMTPPNDEEH